MYSTVTAIEYRGTLTALVELVHHRLTGRDEILVSGASIARDPLRVGLL